MRLLAGLLVVLAVGCGPGNPMVGTWRYETQAQSRDGGTKPVTLDLVLASTASADLLVWRVGGGCNVPMPVTGKVAQMTTVPPLCPMTLGAEIPLLAESGTTLKTNDQLQVNGARFELGDDGKLAGSFDYKMFTNLSNAAVGPVIRFASVAGKHGTRVR